MGFIQDAPVSGRAFRRVAAALAGTAGVAMVFGAGVASASPGSLNTNFASTGSIVHQFGLGSTPASQGGNVAVAPNGDIYQVGSATDSTYDLYIARYLPDGTLDPSFGNGGVTYENVAGPTGATALPYVGPFGSTEDIAITPGGDAVVLTDATTPSGGPELAVLEFNQSGQLNASFGNNGVYTVNVGGKDSFPSGIAVTGEGSIVFTGYFINASNNDAFFAEQLTSDGTLDSSFGTGGLFEPTLGSGVFSISVGVIAQSDGDLAFAAFVEGSSGPDLAVLRTNASGQLDNSFGAAGVSDIPQTTVLPLSPGFAQTADGGYAIASSLYNSKTSDTEASVTRLTADGDPDVSFGTTGTATVAMPSAAFSVANGLFVQADGKLIITGVGADGTAAVLAPFVARVNADGTPDTSFGNGGTTLNPVAGSTGVFPGSAARTADGNVVLSGSTMGSSTESFLQEVNVDTAPTLVTVADADTVQAGTTVRFAAAAVAAYDQTLSQTSWDLGSGNFGDAAGNTASKTFVTAGTYTVRAKVTDAYGLSAISTQTITVTPAPASPTKPTSTTSTTSTTSVTPAQTVAPTLKLVKLSASHGKVKVTLLCAFAACSVTANVTTHEDKAKGKGASLSASGHGKSVTLASSKFTLTVNQTHTFTIKLNKAGRKLLAKFHTIPATGSFKLTNSTPAKAITHKVTVR